MNRAPLVLLAGCVGGLLAHFGWFHLHRPAEGGESLDSQLVWMRDSLGLSPAQFARIKLLHEQSSVRLRALAAEVGRLQGELDAFERERRTAGQIDFLEFARFVDHRRTIDRECLESTRQLVVAASEVMDARQRERYLALLEPTLRAPGRTAVN